MKADNEIRQALCRELEEARYDASLAARRYEVVDPTKRLVARNSRPGGTRRWSGSPTWRTASLGTMLQRRFAPRSIARR